MSYPGDQTCEKKVKNSPYFHMSAILEFDFQKNNYRIVSNKRSPPNKRPLTYFQIKLGKMPKFLYGVSL